MKILFDLDGTISVATPVDLICINRHAEVFDINIGIFTASNFSHLASFQGSIPKHFWDEVYTRDTYIEDEPLVTTDTKRIDLLFDYFKEPIYIIDNDKSWYKDQKYYGFVYPFNNHRISVNGKETLLEAFIAVINSSDKYGAST